MAVGPTQSADLTSLLEQSRTRNSLSGITGLLIYDRGAFLQVLEGDREDVEKIFSSILRDERHTRIKVLTRESKPRREFTTWSMAWADISQRTGREPHSSYHLQQLRPDQAMDYLRGFLRSAGM